MIGSTMLLHDDDSFQVIHFILENFSLSLFELCDWEMRKRLILRRGKYDSI